MILAKNGSRYKPDRIIEKPAIVFNESKSKIFNFVKLLTNDIKTKSYVDTCVDCI